MLNKKDLRIVFFGTPDFAVASLKAIIDQGYNVVGVVTAPDKPAGRGYELQQSAVKKFAVEQHLNVLQPVNLKADDFNIALHWYVGLSFISLNCLLNTNFTV